MSLKSIIVKSSFIEQKGWPDSWKGTSRIVRKETPEKYGLGFINSEGAAKIRWVPKDQVEYTSLESEEVGQTVEEAVCVNNILPMLKALNDSFDEDFRHPSLLPGRTVTVRNARLISHYNEPYLAYEIAENKWIPAVCFVHLPPEPFDPQNISSFINKFNLHAFVDKLKDWSTVVRGSAEGKFITREVYAGNEVYTIRKITKNSTQPTLVSDFGQFRTLEEATRGF